MRRARLPALCQRTKRPIIWLIANCYLPIAICQLLFANCYLPIAICQLLIANCLFCPTPICSMAIYIIPCYNCRDEATGATRSFPRCAGDDDPPDAET